MMLQQSFISPPKLGVQPIHSFLQSEKRCSSRRALEMRIIPCSAAQMSILAPRKVSAEQWGAYWGINKMERLQKVLESLLVAYGGAWMAWFLSMLAGNVISSFTGTALIFNWMYSPWLNAKKRNAKVWRSGNQKLHYALYIGRIVSLKRVKRRAGKTIGAVSQEFLVMTIQDEQQRELEIVTQWQEPYSKLRLQMRCENMIASSKKDFSILSMVTDSWIPACGVWAGDYPYLNRTAFRDFVATVDTSSAKGQRGVRSPGSGDSGTGSGSGRRPRKATSNNDDDMDRKQDIGNLESFVVNDVDAKYFDGFSGGDGVGYDYDGKSKDAYYSDSDVVQVSLDWQVELEEENVYSSIDFVENDNRIGLRRGKGEDFENDAQQSNDDDIDGRLKSVRRSARLQPLPRERQREARGPK